MKGWKGIPYKAPEYTSTGAYLDERAKAPISASQFDDRFGHLLSPEDKENLGITGVEKPLTKTELEMVGWQWLATEEAMALSDEEKARQIKAFGLDPKTFGIEIY